MVIHRLVKFFNWFSLCSVAFCQSKKFQYELESKKSECFYSRNCYVADLLDKSNSRHDESINAFTFKVHIKFKVVERPL